MDEIEWIRKTKKFIKRISIGLVIFTVVASIITLANLTIGYKWEDIKTTLIAIFILGFSMPLLLTICYSIMHISEKIINSGRKIKNIEKNYIRDIPENYSPSIASLIYDLKIDVYKDYTATILYLCTKKYIDIEKSGDTYKITPGERTDYSKLGKCEQYVLNKIINDDNFDENKFKQIIIDEAQQKELITDKLHSRKMKWIFIIAICLILCIICYKINMYLFVFYISIVPVSIGAYHELQKEYGKNTEYIRTKKGNEVARLLGGLKNYIEDYTLIKDKEIDYIQILEEYIPYAISLGEANTIEKFIKYNEKYRDLIYNSPIDKS